MKKLCCTCGKKISMKALLKKEGHKIHGKSYVCDECYKIVGYGKKIKDQEEFVQAYQNALEVGKMSLKEVQKMSIIKKIGKILAWFLVALLLLLAIGAGGISSVLLVITAMIIAPVEKLRELKRIMKIKPVVTVILSVVLFFAAILLSPTPEVSETNVATIEDKTTEISENREMEVKTETVVEETVIEEPTSEELVGDLEMQEAVVEEQTEDSVPVIPENSTFSIRFIDVGQADAALVECDGRYMLIDGGNKSDSSKMYTILKESGIDHLNIMVGTHPDADHIGGLPGALNYATADVVLSPVLEHDTEAFGDFLKYAELNGGGLTVPEAGDKYYLGSSVITILGLNSGSESNDRSIVLKISYGDTSFLFTGDGEWETEQAVLNSGADLSATLLKVGHHGSADSSNDSFLSAVAPMVAIISVGNNNYEHPTTEALDRLEAIGADVYRTDLQGDITVTSDSKSIEITCEKEATKEAIMTSAAEAAEIARIKAEEKAKAEAEARAAEERARAEAEAKAAEETKNNNQVAQSTPSGSGNYAVNMKNGKLHIVGQCSATGSGKNAMKSPKYFGSYEEAYSYAKTIEHNESKIKCGNCW